MRRRQPDAQAPAIVQALDIALRKFRWLALLLAVLYLLTGITSIRPGERAIVLRLGRVNRVKDSGLLIAWPYPIEEVVRVATREAKRLEVKELWHTVPGVHKTGDVTDPLSPEYVFAQEFVPEKIDPSREGYCITGDNDVLQVFVAVKYRVTDLEHYALEHADPEALLRNAIMAAVTQSIGELSVDDALRLRGALSQRIQHRIQDRLDRDEDRAGSGTHLDNEQDRVTSGIHVERVELVYLHPPRHVIREFRDVSNAEREATVKEHQATLHSEARISRARADHTTMVTEAEAEARRLRAEAAGRAQAFRDLLVQYRKDPKVVALRLHREASEEIFGVAPVTIVTAVPGGRTTVVLDFEEPEPAEEKDEEGTE